MKPYLKDLARAMLLVVAVVLITALFVPSFFEKHP
jgi:hypothetical protein